MYGVEKNEKGFGLIEVSISTALFSFLSLLVVSMMLHLSKVSMSYTRELGDNAEKELIKRIILKDLSASSLSFYTLNVKDDRNRNFYHLKPGVEDTTFPKGTVTLTNNNNNKEFSFLRTVGATLAYEVTKAYKTSGDPDHPTYDFNSLNYNDYLTDGGEAEIWKDNKLLLLYTPNPLTRKVLKNLGMHSFLGYVNGGRLVQVGLRGSFIDTHSSLGLSYKVDSEDKFFKSLPPINGNTPIVYLTQVQWVKYGVKECSFKRSVWNFKENSWEVYSLSKNVKEIVLSRNQSNSLIIKMSAHFYEPKEEAELRSLASYPCTPPAPPVRRPN